MAYTAFAKMRKKNFEDYGVDIGPMEPKLFKSKNKNSLKSAALRFIHNSCEGLKFDPVKEAKEERDHEYLGTSLKPNQIPYNMQMDVNRLCLEKCLGDFIDSGSAEDAYLVYYCYLEIFFGHYGKSKKMIELLSEYESNGSSLLMKHRDHYSHSVYVFALGLAVYETNEYYRASFRKYYEGRDGKEYSSSELANIFLEYWGMTSLFHDIGYPFEIPFEQVMSYFEVNKQERGRNTPYIAYYAMDTLTGLKKAETKHFKDLYNKEFHSVNELLAHDIYDKLGASYGFTEKYICKVIESKPLNPDKYGYFMDHAVFSAIRLYGELISSLGVKKITKMHVDALTAIILHNSMYKFKIAFYKDPVKKKEPLNVDLHPLAYLLMLCDELQCWDRTAYGRNSRTELHPMNVDFDFSDNSISAVYYYDEAEKDKIDNFEEKYKAWEQSGEKGKAPRLKAYSDMAEKEQRFTADIEHIINIDIIPLSVRPSMRPVDRKSKQIFLSNSNFMHLYDFAVALHGRYKESDISVTVLEEQFEELSLEYQLSTINRAKNFSRYLDAIHCFYTDRPVDYEMVEGFTKKQAAVIAPLEHERWVREHMAMGWTKGTLYEDLNMPDKKRDLREQMRCHKLAMEGKVTSQDIYEHYLSLSVEDQDKDWKPFNTMLRLLKKFDGLRIYIYKFNS
ncbi:MAG: hypothetical protein K6E72_08410 [Saccharofermentans sp.]|nr:hypothetical protein [Saccharofermentans sp.]